MIKFPKENNDPVKGHYTLGRELGSGAFSKVVEGVHISTGKKYAVKIVSRKKQMQGRCLAS